MINVFAGCFCHPDSWWSCCLLLQNDIYHLLNNGFVLIFLIYFVDLLTFLRDISKNVSILYIFSIFLMSVNTTWRKHKERMIFSMQEHKCTLLNVHAPSTVISMWCYDMLTCSFLMPPHVHHSSPQYKQSVLVEILFLIISAAHHTQLGLILPCSYSEISGDINCMLNICCDCAFKFAVI